MISATLLPCVWASTAGGRTANPVAAAVAIVITSLVMVVHASFPANSAGEAARSSSYSLRQFDGYPATRTDCRGQEGIADCGRCASGTSRVAMLELLGAKLEDVRGKLRVLVAELRELARVMLVDLGLDGIGAGERRLFGHQRSRCAERESGDIPQWLQRGWAHASLRHERVEPVEVPLLLRRHARNELGFRTIPAEH